MDSSYIFEASIHKALDSLEELAAMVWAEDYQYIIAFILFSTICTFLNQRIKKRHSH